MAREAYENQVRLLVACLPAVAKQEVFALKGGTAINLFYRDMPRLSVDIDLTYLPIEDRKTSLATIDATLDTILADISQAVPNVEVKRIAGGGDNDTRVLVRQQGATIKIETSPVARGTVHKPVLMPVSDAVQERFGFAEMPVIDMALLSVIRRWHFREGMPIREIERRTGLSRNTIRKYLRSDTVEPKFKVPARPSKLDPFAQKLSDWLRVEAGKSRKQRRTAKQMHRDLVVLGYEGSYERVAAFVQAWKTGRQQEQQTSGRGTFVPLVFGPGEAFQFDWSEDWPILGGERTKLQVAHTKLSHSRAFIVRAYLLQTHEMLFDAMTQAFRVLGGVPRRGIFDNMKTAVDRIGSGKARQVNARFAAMASHYLFEPEFCNPASGWEKGQVEKNVQDARRRLWQPLPSFPDLGALNAWLEERCIAQWSQITHGGLPGSVADVHAGEVASLMALGCSPCVMTLPVPPSW